MDELKPPPVWNWLQQQMKPHVIASPAEAERLRAEFGDPANIIASPIATEGTVLVYQPAEMAMEMPFKMTFEPPPKIEFSVGLRYGGLDFMRPGFGVISTRLPCPRAPGVEAMLADGWRWLGWIHFAKHNGLPTRSRSERYSSLIHERRVLSGRYAERLPTNRQRKRAAGKARRRARLNGTRAASDVPQVE